MRTFVPGVVLAMALLCSGCILRDEVTTLSVHPDGSASLVVFHSNIRSTEAGAVADQQLREYVAGFEARTLPDCARIAQAGGEVVEARWVQGEAPYASVLVATLPTASALERYGSIGGEGDGLQLTTRYAANGTRRRLAVHARLPEDFQMPGDAARQQSRADAISETRIIVTGGQIVAAQGYTVATDKGSAILSPEEIARLLEDRPNHLEVYVEWEVADRAPGPGVAAP